MASLIKQEIERMIEETMNTSVKRVVDAFMEEASQCAVEPNFEIGIFDFEFKIDDKAGDLWDDIQNILCAFSNGRIQNTIGLKVLKSDNYQVVLGWSGK